MRAIDKIREEKEREEKRRQKYLEGCCNFMNVDNLEDWKYLNGLKISVLRLNKSFLLEGIEIGYWCSFLGSGELFSSPCKKSHQAECPKLAKRVDPSL